MERRDRTLLTSNPRSSAKHARRSYRSPPTSWAREASPRSTGPTARSPTLWNCVKPWSVSFDRLKPEVVLGPDPTATFFGEVYVNHRDHRETGWALLDAVAPAAAMPLYFPEQGPPHQVSVLLLSGTHEPDVVVDVSRTIDTKVKAMLAHASQLGGRRGRHSRRRARASRASWPTGRCGLRRGLSLH